MTFARDGIAPDAHVPAVDCDEIDAGGTRPWVAPLQLGGSRQQTLLLPPRQRMHRAVAATRTPTLYLDDDKQATAPADEIDLCGWHPHVTPHNHVAPQEVEQRGEHLTVAPNLGGSPTQPARSARRSAGGHDTVRVA